MLFEIMRSFVTLAHTLNLSHAVEQLSSTRQTLRRHITILEEIKGGPLFDISDRRYALSPLGEQILPEARELLISADNWLLGRVQKVGGLQYLSHSTKDGWYFYLQQHPLERAFNSSGDLLREVLAAWGTAGGALDHEAMRAVRPVCNVFRRVQDSLLFNEVGEHSSFVSWFGERAARSAIGRPINQMPGGADFNHLVNIAYTEIEQSQSIRLDHIHTILPKGDERENVPIAYERLMLGARFPDDSPAIVSVVRRTYDIEIKDIGLDMLRRMPKEALM